MCVCSKWSLTFMRFEIGNILLRYLLLFFMNGRKYWNPHVDNYCSFKCKFDHFKTNIPESPFVRVRACSECNEEGKKDETDEEQFIRSKF